VRSTKIVQTGRPQCEASQRASGRFKVITAYVVAKALPVLSRADFTSCLGLLSLPKGSGAQLP
jgi:hypothetical protein